MSSLIDLTNQIFGELKVLEYSHSNTEGRSFWKCECSCGKIAIVKSKYLKNGDTKSCGCKKQQYFENYYLNNKFGLLQPQSRFIKNEKSYYLCKCDCGNTVSVAATNLKTSNSTSCGCKNTYTFDELKGKKFGYLTPIKFIDTKLLCLCDCNKEVLLSPYEMVSNNKTSCGCKRTTEMRKRWAKRSYTKEFITYIRRYISSSYRYEIYKRDSFKCQICESSKYLNVHHIIPVKENNKLTSILDPTNCITLCRSCHYGIAHNGNTKTINTELHEFFIYRVNRKYITTNN